MGTPVDFWSLEDCVKALSELSEARDNQLGRIAQVQSRARELLGNQMSSYSSSEDAIRQLLAEKERDLELAAQIGSRLLEQNKELERRLETLDTQLLSANDRAQQLRHELSQKEQLVQVYSQICEEAQSDDLWSSHTPTQPSPQHYSTSASSATSGSISISDVFSPRSSRRGVLSTGLDQLQMQISQLEEENNRLRLEHEQLLSKKKDKEDKSLVEDCLRQLSDANSHIKSLSDDLTKKTDKFMLRQTEVTDLFDRSVQMEDSVKQLTMENKLLNNRLEFAQTSQSTLTDQLTDLRDKYDQCLSMLSDAHSEIRRVSVQQQQPSPRMPRHSTLSPAKAPPIGCSPTNLAAELHESLLAEVEEDDEDPTGLISVASCSEMPDRNGVPARKGLRRSSYPWDLRPEDRPSSSTSSSAPSSDDESPHTSRLRKTRRGRAGKHQRASRRLQPQEVMSDSSKWSPVIRGASQPLQDKPDGDISEARKPQTVQMVKSMEGSTTLRQWQKLAKPSMSGALFERRPGVRVRGCSGSRKSGFGFGGLGGLLSDDSSDEGEKEKKKKDEEVKKMRDEVISQTKEKREEENQWKTDDERIRMENQVVFGLGGLGMENATREKVPPHTNKSTKKEHEEEDEELKAEVAAITFRMNSAPPDPSRTLESLNQRRMTLEKPSPLPLPVGATSPSTGGSMSNLDSNTKPIALAHHGFSSSNLAAILNEKGIHSKTYEQLVGEGYPVPPPAPAPDLSAYPTTPRNSPTEEIEERFSRERTPGPVNPTLVLTGLMESLSEIFKPFGSMASLRDENSERGDAGLRRNNSTGSNLDGLNVLAARPTALPAVLHRTDTSVASPKKK